MGYTLIEEIGRGGMGCVYKGTDSAGHLVALKMMSNKVTCYPEYRALFQAEVETLRLMNHPWVVHIVGNPYQDSEGNLVLPMEYVEGQTLDRIVSRQGPLSVADATRIMSDVLEAMQYVHDRRKIHRDIKPSNIMVRPDGSICIIDFGIAKDAKIGSGNTVGRIIGTDGYMSPEQANGLNIDLRTDIYSLGCVFYFLLTGRHAISKGSNEYETINSILNYNVCPPSSLVRSVPANIDRVVMKAMDKNMTLRYATAAEFRAALNGTPASYGDCAAAKVTIGSAHDNDIVVNNEYVSRHHLVIEGRTDHINGLVNNYMVVTDNSTNGTAVNGRPLRHSSINVGYDRTVEYPHLLLAARAECPVNWKQVIGILHQKGWIPEKRKKVTGGGVVVVNPDPSTGDTPNVFIVLLSFLIPIVGWILWGVWYNGHPRKANPCGIAGIIGFVVNLILILTVFK